MKVVQTQTSDAVFDNFHSLSGWFLWQPKQCTNKSFVGGIYVKMWCLASGFSSYTVLLLLLCRVLLLLLHLGSLARSSKAAKPVQRIRWPVIWADGGMVICLQKSWWRWQLLKTLHMWKRTPQAQGQSPIGQDSRHRAGSNILPARKVFWEQSPTDLWTCQGCKKKQRRIGSGCGFPPCKISMKTTFKKRNHLCSIVASVTKVVPSLDSKSWS